MSIFTPWLSQEMSSGPAFSTRPISYWSPAQPPDRTINRSPAIDLGTVAIADCKAPAAASVSWIITPSVTGVA
ncbi:MAG: hypothetical protein ABSF70_14005 [Terracidiphilus sp.]